MANTKDVHESLRQENHTKKDPSKLLKSGRQSRK